MELDKKYDLLTKEHELISNHIHEQISSNEKFVSLGLTILGAGFFLSYKENILLVIHLITIAFGGLILYGIFHFIFTFSNIGYLKNIENKLNTLLGERLLLRTEIWEKTIINSFTLIVLYILLSLFYAFIIFVSLKMTLSIVYLGIRMFWIMSCVYAFLILAIVFSFRKMLATYEKSYRISHLRMKEKINT
jgi:hypothetical protein